jgi:hypothetical protein
MYHRVELSVRYEYFCNGCRFVDNRSFNDPMLCNDCPECKRRMSVRKVELCPLCYVSLNRNPLLPSYQVNYKNGSVEVCEKCFKKEVGLE